MRSRFSIAGHPFHPMLVTVPIGLFVWAFACDIIYLATDKDKMWYDMSFWTGGVAILTALVAALPGFGDYLTMAVNSEVRGMATIHMLLNLTLVALYFIAWVLMLDAGALDGGRLSAVVVLHALGSGMLLLSGIIGGEMVYRHHLAMVPDDAESERVERTHHEMRAHPGMRR